MADVSNWIGLALKALRAAVGLAHSHKERLHIICVPATREEVIGDKELADRKFAGVVVESGSGGKRHRVKLISYIVVGHVCRQLSRPWSATDSISWSPASWGTRHSIIG